MKLKEIKNLSRKNPGTETEMLQGKEWKRLFNQMDAGSPHDIESLNDKEYYRGYFRINTRYNKDFLELKLMDY